MKKNSLRLLTLFLVILLMLPLAFTNASAISNAAEATQGVVRIAVLYEKDGVQAFAYGSGFAVGREGEDPQYFVTNWHVAQQHDPQLGEPKRIYILLQDNAIMLDYKCIDLVNPATNEVLASEKVLTKYYVYENRTELCEVEVERKEQYPDFTILNAGKPIPGIKPLALQPMNDVGKDNNVTKAYALGFPGINDATTYNEDSENVPVSTFEYMGMTVGYREYSAENKLQAGYRNCHINDGVVSLKTRDRSAGDTMVLQHNVPISFGHSGGPLVLSDGSVIGINTYGRVDTESAYASNYTVDINYVIDALDELKIPYTKAGQVNVALVVVLSIALAALVALLVLLVLQRKKGINLFSKKPGKASGKKPADSGLRIQGLTGTYAGKRFALNGEVTIGRDAKHNNLSYPPEAKGISARHCILSVRDGRVYLRDLSSTYGTFINNRKVQPMIENELRAGDIMGIGSDKETFRLIQKQPA